MINQNESIKQSPVESLEQNKETNEEKYDKQKNLSDRYASEILKLPETEKLKIQERLAVLSNQEKKAKNIKFERGFIKKFIIDFENLS